MSSLNTLILLLFLTFLTSCNNENGKYIQAKPSWQSYGDGMYRLSMANVLLEVDSNTGGRIITLAIDDFNLLTGPEIDSINYGSTLWLSPQKLWYWPPPVALDRSQYQVLGSGDTLCMQSQVDEKFGVSFRKEMIPTAQDTSILINYTIQNNTQGLQNYAIWEVTRMLKDSKVYFSLEEDTTLRSIREPFWQTNDARIEVPVTSEDTLNNKMYANGKGWLIYHKDSLALIKTFPDLNSQQMPPSHNEVEVYIAKTPYQEVEQHSAYVQLLPGEEYLWQVRWYPRKVSNDNELQRWIQQLENRTY